MKNDTGDDVIQVKKKVTSNMDVGFAIGSHDDTKIMRLGKGKLKLVKDPRSTRRFRQKALLHKTVYKPTSDKIGTVTSEKGIKDVIEKVDELELSVAEQYCEDIKNLVGSIKAIDVNKAYTTTPICCSEYYLGHHSAWCTYNKNNLLNCAFSNSCALETLTQEKKFQPTLAPIMEEGHIEMAYKSTVHQGKRYEVHQPNLAIGDSGSSCNFCSSIEGMFNLRAADINVNGQFASNDANIAGDKLALYKQVDGRTTVRKQEWVCLPGSETLFSVTKCVSEGATVFTDKSGQFHVV